MDCSHSWKDDWTHSADKQLNGGRFVWNSNPKENCHGFRGRTQSLLAWSTAQKDANIVVAAWAIVLWLLCTENGSFGDMVVMSGGCWHWLDGCYVLCFLFFLDSTVVSTCAQYLYQKLDWWAAVCLFWEELNSVFFVCSHTTDLRTLKIYQKYLLK